MKIESSGTRPDDRNAALRAPVSPAFCRKKTEKDAGKRNEASGPGNVDVRSSASGEGRWAALLALARAALGAPRRAEGVTVDVCATALLRSTQDDCVPPASVQTRCMQWKMQ